jgi:DNA-binding protein HU-beta
MGENSECIAKSYLSSLKDRAARTGRNPQTGAEIEIAASKAPVFKPGKQLKELVNQ